MTALGRLNTFLDENHRQVWSRFCRNQWQSMAINGVTINGVRDVDLRFTSKTLGFSISASG
jgi:hypothetical protein